jgi:ATP-dependent DNA ligase
VHVEGDGAKMFEAICKLGLEGIVSKKLDAPYRSGLSKSWLKTKNPKGGHARPRRDVLRLGCPLSGVKRTSRFKGVMSANDPKRTSALYGCPTMSV